LVVTKSQLRFNTSTSSTSLASFSSSSGLIRSLTLCSNALIDSSLAITSFALATISVARSGSNQAVRKGASVATNRAADKSFPTDPIGRSALIGSLISATNCLTVCSNVESEPSKSRKSWA
jgi:hypothetical protein